MSFWELGVTSDLADDFAAAVTYLGRLWYHVRARLRRTESKLIPSSYTDGSTKVSGVVIVVGRSLPTISRLSSADKIHHNRTETRPSAVSAISTSRRRLFSRSATKGASMRASWM